MWLLEDRGSTHHINKSVKRGLVFIIPVKFAAFRSVGNKCIKWGGEHTEVANVHSVEVEKAEKGTQFS